jgi:DNA-directed RNA polymerase specialized sigma24 family protein
MPKTIEKRRISPRERQEAAFQAAWEELVHRYDALLHGQVRRSLRSAGFPTAPEFVEERVQEVYCRLLVGGTGRLRLLRGWSERQVVTYLSRVAQRVVVDEVRARSAAKRGGGARAASAGCLRKVAERAVDPRGTPEDQALLAEHRRILLERCRPIAESMLGWDDRRRCLRILHLALLEGWSSREIARAENGRLTPSTVDTLVHRIRQRLARGGFGLPSRRTDLGALLSSPP